MNEPNDTSSKKLGNAGLVTRMIIAWNAWSTWNRIRPSIELNEGPVSIKPKEVRSKPGQRDPGRSTDPSDWDPGGDQ